MATTPILCHNVGMKAWQATEQTEKCEYSRLLRECCKHGAAAFITQAWQATGPDNIKIQGGLMTMLYPILTDSRCVMDLSGTWEFKRDADGKGFEEK